MGGVASQCQPQKLNSASIEVPVTSLYKLLAQCLKDEGATANQTKWILSVPKPAKPSQVVLWNVGSSLGGVRAPLQLDMQLPTWLIR